jgi:hypothetical protein
MERAMGRHGRWLLTRMMLVAAVASLAACAALSDNDSSPTGHKPGSTLDNGLTPEPWGETS